LCRYDKVGTVAELRHQTKMIRETAADVFAETGVTVKFRVGTMIEIPRACLLSDKVAAEAEFFSFGTNDLTQMTFGYSRDDVSKFLPTYIEQGILPHDPFQVLDQDGVGQLIEMSIERGRKANPDLKVGICGEHGGDPTSVDFFHRQVGLYKLNAADPWLESAWFQQPLSLKCDSLVS
jgi:pyruvate,orthophosphate dikinase